MKKIQHKTIYWEAAKWTIERVNDPVLQTEILSDGKQGSIVDGEHKLSFRFVNRDQALKCIFHEIIHKMFWEESDEEKIKNAEVVLKSYLDANGVNLSPLLKGFK